MDVFERKLGDIKPYPDNPRHNDDAVEGVAESIKQYGFKVPIIVDANGVIIAGHTRLKAAQSLRLKSIPVIVADDLTPEQVRAFRIADNKTGDMSEWDYKKLIDELDALDGLDVFTGFVESEAFEDIQLDPSLLDGDADGQGIFMLRVKSDDRDHLEEILQTVEPLLIEGERASIG